MKQLSSKVQHETEAVFSKEANLADLNKDIYMKEIKPAVIEYIEKKRKWFKAFEIIVEIVTRANDEDLANTKERNIFRHQFILNYLNAGDKKAKLTLMNELIYGLRIVEGN